MVARGMWAVLVLTRLGRFSNWMHEEYGNIMFPLQVVWMYRGFVKPFKRLIRRALLGPYSAIQGLLRALKTLLRAL